MNHLPGQKRALVVHSDLGLLSNFQSALTRAGYITIVARDLSSALLAMTQHQFQLGLVGVDLGEPGAGWPLAGVLRMAFPKAFIAVLDQRRAQVAELQSAINYGVQQIYLQSAPAADVVTSILADVEHTSSDRAQ